VLRTVALRQGDFLKTRKLLTILLVPWGPKEDKMKNTNGSKPAKNQSDVAALRSSRVHNLKPLYDNAVPVEVSSIDLDPTNPGTATQSLRDSRRAGSIRDSYDILARIIYPVIVCQNPKQVGRYIHVDGYGRLKEARARGQQLIEAIVYPPMDLEQRICMRQTLNAAQEPFDAVSIIHDLQELAKIRKADTSDPEQVRTLVRDLPERVRKHEKDLLMLARLHPSAVSAMGESYRKDGATIGLDKFRNIARVLRSLEDRHPKTVAKLGGPRELSLKVSKMYIDKKFSEGTRSQEAIRRVAQALDQAPENDPRVTEFFEKERPFTELPSFSGGTSESTGKSEIIDACRTLTKLLLDVDTEILTKAELRALERTESVLNKVLVTSKA
jgi:ParB-like chromosome segregation protein Spo0J